MELAQCPRESELAAPQSAVPSPATSDSQGSIVIENPVDDGYEGYTTETATVSMTEDGRTIKTTRTTVTTITVIEPKETKRS